jgi:hypothetical protein
MYATHTHTHTQYTYVHTDTHPPTHPHAHTHTDREDKKQVQRKIKIKNIYIKNKIKFGQGGQEAGTAAAARELGQSAEAVVAGRIHTTSHPHLFWQCIGSLLAIH